jgi:hypothetical protein
MRPQIGHPGLSSRRVPESEIEIRKRNTMDWHISLQRVAGAEQKTGNSYEIMWEYCPWTDICI